MDATIFGKLRIIKPIAKCLTAHKICVATFVNLPSHSKLFRAVPV